MPIDDFEKKINYGDSYFTMKQIEYYFDYYDYGYIPYLRFWLDLSTMDDKDLRWLLDGYGKYLYPNNYGSFSNVSKNLTISFKYPFMSYINVNYNEDNKDIFVIAYGKREKTLEKINRDYEICISVEGKGSYYYFGKKHIPYEMLNLEDYPNLQEAFRKLNPMEY